MQVPKHRVPGKLLDLKYPCAVVTLFSVLSLACGAKLLQRIRTHDIEAWHNLLRTDGRQDGAGGLAPRTISLSHKLLGRALRDAVRHGLIVKNPASEERVPRGAAKPMVILTAEQIVALPDQLVDRPVRAP